MAARRKHAAAVRRHRAPRRAGLPAAHRSSRYQIISACLTRPNKDLCQGHKLDCLDETVTAMKNPPHPGRIVRQECIEGLGLTVTAAAKGLGVTRKTLSELVNGNSGNPRKWPFACPRRSAAAPRSGLVCKWTMISPRCRGRRQDQDSGALAGRLTRRPALFPPLPAPLADAHPPP